MKLAIVPGQHAHTYFRAPFEFLLRGYDRHLESNGGKASNIEQLTSRCLEHHHVPTTMVSTDLVPVVTWGQQHSPPCWEDRHQSVGAGGKCLPQQRKARVEVTKFLLKKRCIHDDHSEPPARQARRQARIKRRAQKRFG